MDRPTIDFTLPGSKIRIIFYAFLTVGEERDIKRTTVSAMKVKLNQEAKTADLEDFNAGFTIDAQDQTLKSLVKEAYDEDGTLVADPVSFLRNLPGKYEEAIFAKVDELTSASSLEEDAKKNSAK